MLTARAVGVIKKSVFPDADWTEENIENILQPSRDGGVMKTFLDLMSQALKCKTLKHVLF